MDEQKRQRNNVTPQNPIKKMPSHPNELPKTSSEGISFSPVNASVEWKIASNLDLNKLIDQMKSIPGAVLGFLKEVSANMNNYHEIKTATIADIPLNSKIFFQFANADKRATLRFEGLMKTAEWSSTVNDNILVNHVVSVPGRSVIIVEHFNDNGLAEFMLNAYVNGKALINVSYKEDDMLWPSRRRLFIFKFNVIPANTVARYESELPDSLKELVSTASSLKSAILVDGKPWDHNNQTVEKLISVDADLSKQLHERLADSAREAEFRKEVLQNPLTRPHSQEESLPIHFSIDIDTKVGWSDVNWNKCDDKACVENHLPNTVQQSGAESALLTNDDINMIREAFTQIQAYKGGTFVDEQAMCITDLNEVVFWFNVVAGAQTLGLKVARSMIKKYKEFSLREEAMLVRLMVKVEPRGTVNCDNTGG